MILLTKNSIKSESFFSSLPCFTLSQLTQMIYSNWKISNTAWATIGITFSDNKVNLPDGWRMSQSGNGGHNTFTSIYDHKNKEIVRINEKKAPWESYCYIWINDKRI